MTLDFLLKDLKERVAKLEQAARTHDVNPAWDQPDSLWECAKRVQVTAKYIARLSKQCPTLHTDSARCDVSMAPIERGTATRDTKAPKIMPQRLEVEI